MSILITGVAGFIGFNLAKSLLENGFDVIGIDNLNTYYEPSLKISRLSMLEELDGFSFYKMNLEDKDALFELKKTHDIFVIINLAAQAGVRYSLTNPEAYISSNVNGFFNVLELAKSIDNVKLLYASSSSVYGANTKTPFSESDPTEAPLSLYAATKKSNELMASSYSSLFDINCIGLRFFTVYGPWGRPDMALFKFTKAILNNEIIDVYNNGEMSRSFTYIDDIVLAINILLENVMAGGDFAKHEIYNIGNESTIQLNDFVQHVEKALDKKAMINYLPLQAGDAPVTIADMTKLKNQFDFTPKVELADGVKHFVNWYRDYYKV